MSQYTTLPRVLTIEGRNKLLGMKFYADGYLLEYTDEKDGSVFLTAVGVDKEDAAGKLAELLKQHGISL
jgi:hypothetical protein